MKFKFLPLVALISFAQNAFGGDGVIMKTIQNQIHTVEIKQSNGVRDDNATVYARFGFAMGLYGAEKRVQVPNLYPNAQGVFAFKKYNDSNVWEACTVTGAQLSAGQFKPSCKPM